MIIRAPRWTVVITHLPTGIEVVRDSNHFGNRHMARESAMRYLKSRLYARGMDCGNVEREVSVTELPDDNPCPQDLGCFRAKTFSRIEK